MFSPAAEFISYPWWLQRFFLYRVCVLESRVMETLVQTPAKALWEPRGLNPLMLSPGPDSSDYAVIRDAVKIWAKDWNLAEPWVIDAAMFTLRNTPNGAISARFMQAHYKLPQSLTIGEHLAESFADTRIDPGFDDFDDFTPEGVGLYKEILLELCELFIDQYIADRFEIVEGKTFPWSRETLERYVDWCVRYQVQEDSYRGLAKEAGVARQTVTEAVKGIAAYMKLTLRPPRRGGRPPKGAG